MYVLCMCTLKSSNNSCVSFQLFLACLKNLQSVNILKEIDTEKLFSNITEILVSNVCFWRNTLFPLVRDMRTYKQPPCVENMCEGFSKMRETFQAYFKYCADQSRCQHYCRDIFAHNELFTAYLAWCETQKECNRWEGNGMKLIVCDDLLFQIEINGYFGPTHATIN